MHLPDANQVVSQLKQLTCREEAEHCCRAATCTAQPHVEKENETTDKVYAIRRHT